MKFRYLISLTVLLITALALSACGSPPSSSGATGSNVSAEAQKYANLKGAASKGKTVFEGTCISCHGPDAKGMPGLGKDLTTSTFVKERSDADMVLFLAKGRPANDPLNTAKVDMPPRGGNPALKDQDLADVVAYVRSLQK
jgi:disulfide bond formation protein DsbB